LGSADGFATRALHGEALERYVRVRTVLEELPGADDETRHSLWRRAAIGEARARCMLGDGFVSLPTLRILGTEFPRDPETLALFACSAASAAGRGDISADVARTAMLRLLRLQTSGAGLMHFAGDAAVHINDEGLALAFYRRALALDPTRPSARVSIAQLLRRRGDLLAARLELVAAIAVAPGLREAILELSRVHRDAKRPLEALATLTCHLAENATDIDGLVLLSEVLTMLERDADARVAVSRVLRHAPDDTGGLWFDGLLLMRQGRTRDATERWRRAVSSGAIDEFTTLAQRSLSQQTTLRLVS